MRRTRGTAFMGALLAVSTVVAGCGAAPGQNSTALPSGQETAGASLPLGLVQPETPSFADATLIGGAEAEIEATREGRTDAGFVELLEPNGQSILDEVDQARISNGQTQMAAAAEAFGLDLEASALIGALHGAPGADRPPPNAEWTGSVVGHAAQTISMMTGMMVTAIERAGGSINSRVPSDETITSTANGVTETTRLVMEFALQAGGGEINADVTITATTEAKNASTGAHIGTLTGRGHGHIEVNACPDAEGMGEGRLSLSSEEELTEAGGAAAGFAKSFDGPFTLINGDNAHLVQIDATFSMANGAHGPGTPGGEPGGPFNWGASVTMPATIAANGGVTLDTANVRGDQDGATDRQFQATMNGYLPAYAILVEIGKAAERFWRSGECIELQPSRDGGTVEPSEEINLTVDARHKFDSQQVEGGIVATFSGTESINPSGTPVDAPAPFTFVAGEDDGDTGIITLEQTGKRGIGRKTLEFRVGGIDRVTIAISGSRVFHSPHFLREMHTSGSAVLVRQPDGKLRGTGTFHVRFFNEWENGCRVDAAGDIPVEIWIWPDGLGDPDFLLSVDLDWTNAPMIPIATGDCQYSGDLAGEFGGWEVGIRITARLDGGPHTETMDLPEVTYTSTTTISR